MKFSQYQEAMEELSNRLTLDRLVARDHTRGLDMPMEVTLDQFRNTLPLVVGKEDPAFSDPAVEVRTWYDACPIVAELLEVSVLDVRIICLHAASDYLTRAMEHQASADQALLAA